MITKSFAGLFTFLCLRSFLCFNLSPSALCLGTFYHGVLLLAYDGLFLYSFLQSLSLFTPSGFLYLDNLYSLKIILVLNHCHPLSHLGACMGHFESVNYLPSAKKMEPSRDCAENPHGDSWAKTPGRSYPHKGVFTPTSAHVTKFSIQ